MLLAIQMEKSVEQELDISLEFREGVWAGDINLGVQ